jgi:hypothetical protein
MVYSSDRDLHANVYCELNVLSALSFPRYTCRIPNREGHQIEVVHFSVDEQAKRLGHDIEPTFIP